jgi:hypothetical protein
MATTSPPPGFYDDPDNPGKKRWWDGNAWTDVTDGKGPAIPGLGNLPDVGTLAGGALIADGLIGFGANRQGIFGSLVGIVVGVGLAVGVGVFLAPAMLEQSSIDAPVPSQATVLQVDRLVSQADPTDQSSSSSVSCAVVLGYSTSEGQAVEAATPYSSSSLCSFVVGQTVAISYDASNVGRFEGLDPTGEAVQQWFPYLFIGVGVIIALSSAWTFLLRATQIGGGIYLINRSRQKDRERLAKKAIGRESPGTPKSSR